MLDGDSSSSSTLGPCGTLSRDVSRPYLHVHGLQSIRTFLVWMRGKVLLTFVVYSSWELIITWAVRQLFGDDTFDAQLAKAHVDHR